MKRKIALLALPLVLAALMLGVKWRAENPTPTKEDLEVRALLLSSKSLSIYLTQNFRRRIKAYGMGLPLEDRKLLIDNLFLIPNPPNPRRVNISKNTVTLTCSTSDPLKGGIVSIDIYIDVKDRGAEACEVVIGRHNQQNEADGISLYNLHPVTMRRWLKLLRENQHIAPELRAQMEQ